MSLNPAEDKFFKYLAEQQEISGAKPLLDMTLDEYRTFATFFDDYTGEPADVPFVNFTVPVRDGALIPVRMYNSHLEDNTPVLFYFPGCGYLIDLFEVNAIVASRIAKFSNVKVITVNHRLGPEHPMPGSMFDCFDVLQYVIKNADEYKIDKNKVILSGVSSGGNCAAVISNIARDHADINIYHQILINSWLDLKRTTKGFAKFEALDGMIVPEALEFIIREHKLKSDDLDNPLINPMCEKDLRNLPGTTIIVGQYDGIRADSEGYYLKLKEAGCDVEKIELPGQTHNTIIMRKALSDGVDPAQVVADVILQKLAN